MHEALLNFLWKLTEKTSVRAGIYYNSTSTNVNSSEPVISVRKSSYNYANKKRFATIISYDELVEDKLLEWEYDAQCWNRCRFQLPSISELAINWSINAWLE